MEEYVKQVIFDQHPCTKKTKNAKSDFQKTNEIVKCRIHGYTSDNMNTYRNTQLSTIPTLFESIFVSSTINFANVYVEEKVFKRQ